MHISIRRSFLLLSTVLMILVCGSLLMAQRPTQNPRGEGVRSSQPVFLEGKVAMEDGTPLPDHLRVNYVCSGVTVLQSMVKAGGIFTLQIGGDPYDPMNDASVPAPSPGASGQLSGTTFVPRPGEFGTRSTAGLGKVDLSTCEVTIPIVAGFYSNPLKLGRRSIFNPDIGVIILHRLQKTQGTIISYRTLATPKKAKKAMRNARKELAKKKVDHTKVRGELEKAVELYPEFAEAWTLLGQTRLALGSQEGAHEAFQKAVDADPNYILPYLSLTTMGVQAKQWEAVRKLSHRVIELNPYMTQGHYFYSMANYQLAEFAVAEKSIRTVLGNSDAGKYPLARYLLGAALADQGFISGAAEEFQHFLEISVNPQIRYLQENVKSRISDWERQGLIKENGSSGQSKVSSPK